MSADQNADALVGAVLDSVYAVKRVIGRGGMGTVYEAVHQRLAKRVAIKVMSRDLTSNPEAMSRFHREAQVTSQLGHPHIVQVFDFGTTPAGEPFMAMELLEGEDLDHRIKRVGRMLPVEVAPIVNQVASALAATHAQGVVHRDLKPGNIILLRFDGASDFVKVVDFGISKVRAASTRLTRGNVVMGSPQFMSPEQASGRVDEIDHTTDQWALAAVAFEALTGRAPFVGDDVNAILFQIVFKSPATLTSVAPHLSPALESVIAKALAKTPDARFPSIAAFASAFERAANTPVNSRTYRYHEAVAEDPVIVEDPPLAMAPTMLPPPAPSAVKQDTTLSRNVGELTPSGVTTLRNRPPWLRAATFAGAGVLVVAVIVLLLRGLGGEAPTAAIEPPPASTASAPSITPLPPAVRGELAEVPAPTRPPAPAPAPAKPAPPAGDPPPPRTPPVEEAPPPKPPVRARPKKKLFEEL